MQTSIHNILKKYWGFDSFRDVQEDIIQSVLDGYDTLGLLPTGGGKSICFQVPALAKEGICVVVSPLIALMHDQVDNLKKRGINAVAITSSLTKREIDRLLDNCIYGKVKFLYVSPERLQQALFIERFKRMNVNLIAIDEAHCISQWGYDFRPPYLQIKELRQYHPTVPFLALTATATKDVVQDIQKQLEFKPQHRFFQKSFYRENLQYVVLNEENAYGAMLRVIKNVKGAGIVYVRSRRETVEIAQMLKNQGFSATFYHAGLTVEDRSEKQQKWKDNQINIIVSTNAFGMGIDKPDVRFVVNFGIPDSPEAYFQEAGRAGRDGRKAYAVLVIKPNNDELLEKRLALQFPSRETIKKVYYAICNYYRIALGTGEFFTAEIDIEQVAQKFGIKASTLVYALPFLERAGYVSLSESMGKKSTVKFLLQGQALYDFQVRHQEYDEFIRLLLRSYGGMFETPQKIKEKTLAKRIQQSVEKVKKKLRELHRLEVIEYNEATSLPQLTFLQPRVDVKHLRIPKEIYENRKTVAQKKMEAIIDYAYQEEECRNMKLLHYFNDQTAFPCGKCDVCLKKKKSTTNTKDVAQQIKEYIISNHPSANEVAEHFRPIYGKEQTLNTLEELINNGEIKINSKNSLEERK